MKLLTWTRVFTFFTVAKAKNDVRTREQKAEFVKVLLLKLRQRQVFYKLHSYFNTFSVNNLSPVQPAHADTQTCDYASRRSWSTPGAHKGDCNFNLYNSRSIDSEAKTCQEFSTYNASQIASLSEFCDTFQHLVSDANQRYFLKTFIIHRSIPLSNRSK